MADLLEVQRRMAMFDNPDAKLAYDTVQRERPHKKNVA